LSCKVHLWYKQGTLFTPHFNHFIFPRASNVPDSDTTPAGPAIPPRAFDDDDQIEESAPADRPAAREGLPSSYRMRADAHYVDWLASGPPGGREQMLDPRLISIADAVAAMAPVSDDAAMATLAESVKAHGLLQPLLVQSRGGQHTLIEGVDRLRAVIAAGLRKAPCVTYDVDDHKAKAIGEAARLQAHGGQLHVADVSVRTPSARLGDEGSIAVAKSLKTLALCADMVAADASSLSRTVATDLIRAEVWRSSCLLLAARAVQGDLTAASAPVPVRRLVDRVVKELVPEQRLRGFEVEPQIDVPDGTVIVGDEALLAAAIAGAVLATLPIVEGPDKVAGARLVLKVEAGAQTGASQTVTIELGQAASAAPDGWSSRAFDPTWTERPGGGVAALAMLSVRAIADLHKGRATASSAGRGTRVSFTVPAGLPARRAWH
jgi:hypothetical protein